MPAHETITLNSSAGDADSSYTIRIEGSQEFITRLALKYGRLLKEERDEFHKDLLPKSNRPCGCPER